MLEGLRNSCRGCLFCVNWGFDALPFFDLAYFFSFFQQTMVEPQIPSMSTFLVAPLFAGPCKFVFSYKTSPRILAPAKHCLSRAWTTFPPYLITAPLFVLIPTRLTAWKQPTAFFPGKYSCPLSTSDFSFSLLRVFSRSLPSKGYLSMLMTSPGLVFFFFSAPFCPLPPLDQMLSSFNLLVTSYSRNFRRQRILVLLDSFLPPPKALNFADSFLNQLEDST